jgi:hypothetical protein
MTTIDNINEINQTLSLPQSNGTKARGAGSFETLLSSAIDNKKAVKTHGGTVNGLNEITSPSPEVTQPADIVSGKTDDLLRLLESYSSQLQDPGVTLKSIAPVLENIRDNAGNLLKETGMLSDSDASLKKIATQTAVTAQTEYLKFQRGDYLS